MKNFSPRLEFTSKSKGESKSESKRNPGLATSQKPHAHSSTHPPQTISLPTAHPQHKPFNTKPMPPSSFSSPSPSPSSPLPLHITILFLLLLFTLFFFLWTLTILARLYLYSGALGPPPKRFYIHPKNTVVSHRPSPPASSPPVLSPPTPSSRIEARNTLFPALEEACTCLSTVRCAAGVDVNVKVSMPHLEPNVPDAQTRMQIAEEVRISRLPAFEQDDCGDGREFPGVPYAVRPEEKQEQEQKQEQGQEVEKVNYDTSHPTRSLSSTPRTVQCRALGLEERECKDWLVVDESYVQMHSERGLLLAEKKAECVQVRREGEAACEELLREVAAFLVARYPGSFRYEMVGGRTCIRNEVTKEGFLLVRPFDCHPLEACARLAMEDFNVLVRGEFTGRYYL